MPELGPENLDFIKAMKKHLKDEWLDCPSDKFEQELIKTYNEEYVGSGGEVVVVALKGSKPKKVVAFNYLGISPERAKEIFYLHRFFSTLFPHNFPHFYSSTGEVDKTMNKSVSGTIRRDIMDVQSSIEGENESGTGYYPFTKVKEFCDELGIIVSIDPTSNNFMFGADGGEYYVDTLKRPNVEDWDVNKITQYMERNKYDQKDIEIVQKTVERLKVINYKK